MRLLALISFAALSGMAPATAAPPADPAFATLEMAAKTVVAAIDSEAKTDALFSLFDDEMRKAVPLPQLRGVLGDVRAGLGKVVSRKETSKPEPGTTAYRLAMERGELDMILAVSDDGKIRGLLLRPPGAATPASAKFDAVGANLEAAIRANDAKGLARDFAERTRAALPEPKLREVLDGLGVQMGKLRERGAVSRPGPDTAIWPLKFEKGTLDLKVVLDGDGKVIGIWFLPPGAAGATPKAPERNAVKLRLPLRGRWEVFWGGPMREQNAHHDVPNQRHGFDFVGLHADGQRYQGEGSRNEDQETVLVRPCCAPAILSL